MKDFDIITQEAIEKIAVQNPHEIYKAVEMAYIKHFEGKTINPPSHFLNFPDRPKSRIIALPAAIMEEPRRSGIKWISSNPDNIKQGLKRASAVIILNDYESGFPLACMEGAVISALRTVNSAIISAALVLKNKKVKNLGIIGCGNISKVFLECLQLQDWQIDEVNVFDEEENYAQNFSKNFKQKITTQKSVKEVIKNSQLILFATTAAKPYVSELDWFSHNPCVLNISLRDLAPEIILNSNNIVDDVDHVLKANTAPHLAFLATNKKDFIDATIGEMLLKNKKLDSNKPTIISPMGMGILDIAVSNYVYMEAKKRNMTITIPNFFS